MASDSIPHVRVTADAESQDSTWAAERASPKSKPLVVSPGNLLRSLSKSSKPSAAEEDVMAPATKSGAVPSATATIPGTTSQDQAATLDPLSKASTRLTRRATFIELSCCMY